MKRLFVVTTVLVMLLPLSVGAFNASSRVCTDPVSVDTVTVNLHFRTSATGPVTLKSVARSAMSSDAVRCVAPQIGVTLGTLALPDHATYFLKATAVDAEGNESALSAEVVPSPFLLDATAPGAPAGLSVR